MLFDSDVALLGTGIAPLIAANHLIAQGKTVTLLNPEWDFFLENSELPLDPMLPEPPKPKQLIKNHPDQLLDVLRPDFPGAVEYWSADTPRYGFHDLSAPHVRQRGRLWIWVHSLEKKQSGGW